MNKKPLMVTLMSATVLGMLLGTSCKKDNTISEDRAVVAGGPSGNPGTCPDSTISGVITSNLTLKSCRIYKLSGLVYVSNNATVTIEPGTLIKGIKGSSATVPGGGLIVTRGSKLIAQGTAANPIIFTSNEATPVSGDWSGIVLLGKAPTNHAAATLVEGVPSAPPADATFGGPSNNLPADNSGILKYVRIEYAGYELEPDKELNGLTLAGVGSGTTIDYVEVYKSKDDAFEFFGGTVNASHLIAVDPLDDMYDTDNGYKGTISFALGLSDLTRADKSQSNGFESDNNANGDTILPVTYAKYNNITIIGQPNATQASITNGAPSGTGKYGRAAHLRRSTQFEIKNSIFIGFNYGISLDSAKGNTLAKFRAGVSVLNNNFVQAYIFPYSKEANFAAFATLGTPAGNFGYISATPNVSQIGLVAPFTRGGTNASNYLTNEGTAADVANAGAFPGGADWTAGTTGWVKF